jgi:hypothetical protein
VDTLRIRFVRYTGVGGRIIAAREGECYPFTPTHCELALADGYLGAHFSGGVALRPVGYDAGTFDKELFVDVPCDHAKAAAWARSMVGTPYAWSALISYALPVYLQSAGYLICSSLTAESLTVGGAFKSKHLAAPGAGISPRTLLVVLSAIVPILGTSP